MATQCRAWIDSPSIGTAISTISSGAMKVSV